MEKLIRQLKESKKRFLVVGDAMLDSYLYGNVSRISPEAPVPVFNYLKKESVLGGAANVAANVAAMGFQVSLMAVAGQDDAAKELKALLQAKQIGTELVYEAADRATTVKTRIVSGGQQMLRIDDEDTSDISAETQQELTGLLEEAIAQYDIILMSDYMKGFLTNAFTSQVIAIAKAHQVKVIVDVKAKNPSKYAGAYLLKPNRRELAYMTDMPVETRDEVIAAMKVLKQEADCNQVIATLSGDGMMFLSEDGHVYESNVEAKQVCDVVGAGDTAFSYIGLGIVENVEPQLILQLANGASSIKVTKFGTAVVTLDEMEQMYGQKPEKVQNLQGLLTQLSKAREQGKKIVFTNGCFDILHLGHTRYLKKAKGLGDLLIVAVNSDASVKRLKGEGRPINNEDNRLAMLAELDFIDYVIKFGEDTPYELIQAIQPDVLVKGGDYEIQDIVGHDIVEAKGGLVTTIPLVDGMSTTNIINSIQQHEENK